MIERDDMGRFKRERTAAERRASRAIFGDPDYVPTIPTSKFIVGSEWISYVDLVKRYETGVCAMTINNDEADAKRIALAEELNFEHAEVHCGVTEVYSCAVPQLIAFAKSCEANGRAQIGAALRKASAAASGDLAVTLKTAADVVDAINARAGQ